MNTNRYSAITALAGALALFVSAFFANHFGNEKPNQDSPDIENRVTALEERLAALEKMMAASDSTDENPGAFNNGLVPFKEVTLNLDSQNSTRYLRMSVVFAVKKGNEKELTEAIENENPRFMHSLITLAAETQPSEVLGEENITQLAEKLKTSLNAVLSDHGHEPYIADVLFQKFQVQ